MLSGDEAPTAGPKRVRTETPLMHEPVPYCIERARHNQSVIFVHVGSFFPLI